MSEPSKGPEIKRFYKVVSVAETSDGFALELDGRKARTPGKRPLVSPSRRVAEWIAGEWAEQGDSVRPVSMPVSRIVNSAIDGVASTMDETRGEIAKYSGADLVCYRAEEPAELVALQAKHFDPVLTWAREALGANFEATTGILFVEQKPEARRSVEALLLTYAEPSAVAALHVLTSLSGSALVALMLARGAISAGDAWRVAHVDEDFQISKWGEDYEAAERRKARWREFEAAARILDALRDL